MTKLSDTARPLGSEVVIASGADDPASEPGAVGPEVSQRLGLPLRWLHVEPADGVDLATAIVGELASDSVLVIHSEHANRWSGKWSIAEHVIDAWGGVALATGSKHVPGARNGPVLVGVDGSQRSEAALAPASSLADAFGVGVAACQVVPASQAGEVEAIAERLERRCDEVGLPHAEIIVLVGNDPISALVEEAAARASTAIALASIGDRSSRRSSISRTCSGVIASAVQPVMIVGPLAGA